MMQLRNKGVKWSPISSLTPFLFLLITIVVAHAHMLEPEEKDDDSNEMRLELIHRHDPRIAGNQQHGTVSGFEQIKELARRDIIRHQRLLNGGYTERRKNWEIFQMPMHAGLDYDVGEYFVQVRIGTPAQKFWLIADTGSDLTWVNCRYCTGNCEPHSRKRRNRVSHRRVFLANRSLSFHPVTCSSRQCKVDLSELFSLTTCPNPSDPCRYDYRYMDGSAALGLFGSETITVSLTNGKKRKLKDMLIGCTKNATGGSSFNSKTDGVLGLSIAKESFLVKAAREYGGKFSYCLVDHLSHKNVSNYLSFGGYGNSKTTLLGDIRQTPLALAPPFFGVNVIGISIGGQLLKIPSEIWNIAGQGGLIMDSGTSLTLLAEPAYEPVIGVLLKALEKFDSLEKEISPFEHCYNASGFDEGSVPRLAFHFEGGARFEPPVKSYVLDAGPNAKCIGILPTAWPGSSTLGNILQQNHLWEFDLLKNIVGFAPSACT
ncbi:hypothetical protein L6164_022920 [Bauhinia variegata]|uniref:Uncharacterized protein n=1 Tax=Bauhinia variegata TaxID=167791 RepID=A0ACB9MGP3_BAUVA|nr:hypothetical protein L6164_022920 [Bauhinia variegata]